MAFRRKLKNFVKLYSDVVVKVREATSNDPWGSSGCLMMEIAEMTYFPDSLLEIMQTIWHRMNDSGKNWRHVNKSLTLLDYLIKNGSRQVIAHCIQRAYNIQLLKDFYHIDNDGKDQGIYVRKKSTQIIELLVDAEKLKSEREAARNLKKQMFLSNLHSAYEAPPTVRPTLATSVAPFTAVLPTVTYQDNVHLPEPSINYSGLHPSTSFISTQVPNPIQSSETRRVSSRAAQDFNVPNPPDPFLLFSTKKSQY